MSVQQCTQIVFSLYLDSLWNKFQFIHGYSVCLQWSFLSTFCFTHLILSVENWWSLIKKRGKKKTFLCTVTQLSMKSAAAVLYFSSGTDLKTSFKLFGTGKSSVHNICLLSCAQSWLGSLFMWPHMHLLSQYSLCGHMRLWPHLNVVWLIGS